MKWRGSRLINHFGQKEKVVAAAFPAFDAQNDSLLLGNFYFTCEIQHVPIHLHIKCWKWTKHLEGYEIWNNVKSSEIKGLI